MAESERTDRCFFLAPGSSFDAPELAPEDAEHLRRVLRARAGDRVTAFDGRGGRAELVVRALERRELVLALDGVPRFEPEPGAPGAALEWLEIAAPLPRGARAEELVDRLVQLGVARLVPLGAERTQGDRESLSPARRERLRRIGRAAAKQSRRAWELELADELEFAAWLGAGARVACFLADPGAPRTLLDALAELPREPRGTRARPLALVFGPEGGFTDGELEIARAAGAIDVALGPHVLRIETAAEAAAASVVQARWEPAR
ncbi:MAG: 16S rRNA (uracil(1498)-N(3))-methyltransferase [Planctomycetes bacterium]|nr:16S rRNA (uracil(1498)-N(3))-methyltransferase [Planctomycetota bacterium]